MYLLSFYLLLLIFYFWAFWFTCQNSIFCLTYYVFWILYYCIQSWWYIDGMLLQWQLHSWTKMSIYASIWVYLQAVCHVPLMSLYLIVLKKNNIFAFISLWWYIGQVFAVKMANNCEIHSDVNQKHIQIVKMQR